MVAPEAANSPTAPIVPIPQANRTLDLIRRRLDPSERQGMPAHVTVLWPFLSLGELDAGAEQRLRSTLAAMEGFSCCFGTTGWFDRRVLFLEPAPTDRFVQVTEAVVAAFPSCLPYRGEYAEIRPHCTVGDGAWWWRLGRAERQVRRELP
jgi:hypothetical protein